MEMLRCFLVSSVYLITSLETNKTRLGLTHPVRPAFRNDLNSSAVWYATGAAHALKSATASFGDHVGPNGINNDGL